MADVDAEPEAPQCRICYDGVEQGRLIRPCKCKGSVAYVHVSCLKTWRNVSASGFYACGQCGYRYNFKRTHIAGLASNQVVVATLSTLIFVALTMLSSTVTSFFLSFFRQVPEGYGIYGNSWLPYYVSPLDVIRDLVSASLNIIETDEHVSGSIPLENGHQHTTAPELVEKPQLPFLKGFLFRFLLGLPLIGAGSIVHLLISFSLLGPAHWLARYHARNRRRNNNSKDLAGLIVVALVLLGTARALYKVYQLTQHFTKKMLLRAEDAVLEPHQ